MDEQNNNRTEDLVEKIKALVKQGNIARILVKRGDNTVLNVPVNAGVLGAAIGVTMAPWALIAAAVASLGLDCKVELVKTDGDVIELLSRDVGKKAAGIGSSILDNIANKKK